MTGNQKKLVKIIWIAAMLPVAILLLFLLLALSEIPSFEQLESPDSKLATQILSDDGRALSTFHLENRTFVRYDELSPYLVQAAVATEDKRFYEHSGVDVKSLYRVFFKTLLANDSSQGGGSTITQQLAKTLYPREDLSSYGKLRKVFKMGKIKVKEWITAVLLERNYSKDEIMDMYMNAIFFGSGSYGVKAASETFFFKHPSELNVEEAATLVGMVNKPTRYNPRINPDKSLERRNHVLRRMAEMDYLTDRECDSLQKTPIVLNYHLSDHNAGLAPYFRDFLRVYMGAQKPKRSSYTYPEDYSADSLRWCDDELYGWLEKNRKADGSKWNLFTDGLRIQTTLNYNMQKYAEEAVAEHLGKSLQPAFEKEQKYRATYPFDPETPKEVLDMLMRQARRYSDRYRNMAERGCSEKEILAAFNKKEKMRVFAWNEKGYTDVTMSPNDSIRYYKSILRSAFVAIEPCTGAVKAYVGGPNYRYFKYDNIGQGKRQVGSTIKPFLYTLAMQEGISPCDRVMNVPQTFEIQGSDETWTPKSTDKDEWIGQSVTIRWGLMKSSNNISAYLMKQFGPHSMVQMMRRMGISSHVDEVYSLCVGSCDLSLMELVAAYNTFPSNGVYITPMMVTGIEDRTGNLLTSFTSRKREAISEETAYLMENLMSGVVNSGTAVRLRSVYGLQGDIAGKTGTNNDQADGWFVGYTPKITAGIWTGGEDRQVHFAGLALGGGSNMALPIWGIFMTKCMADPTLGFSKEDRFQAPAGFSATVNCEDDIRAAESGEVERPASTEEENYFD